MATKTKAITQKKPKYKVGDMVYSYQNPTKKREINRVFVEPDAGYQHKYRLSLVDAEGNKKHSNWTSESSLSKTKPTK
jgi:hypothetical protein